MTDLLAPSWAELLPPVRGRSAAFAPLAPNTWFRVGGPAELLIRPADSEDLAQVLRALPRNVPLTVLGAASNLIVRDGGIPGLVVRLARGFGTIEVQDDGLIAGAGALDATIAQTAGEAGLAGLEFLSGIPGTLGGAVAMNAGCYGSDLAQVLDWAEFVTPTGDIERIAAKELTLSYRHTELPEGAVVIRARLCAVPGDRIKIIGQMAEIRTQREATQPIRARTGGSTFRNPPGEKAWALIDAAGCRGLTVGGAMVSEKHTNFMINTGTATAADLENLGEMVRERVRAASGIVLEWEIKRLGRNEPISASRAALP